MKKTLTINLNGTVFNIEEDAYILLKGYLDAIKESFASFEDSQEIITDIEARIAERFSENLSESKQAVTSTDVEELMRAMGSVEDITGKEKTEAPKEKSKIAEWRKKKLYRDPDNAILCGVASGIAAYFGIDPVFVRLIFVLSLFFGGAGIIAYLILCFIVPEAKTTAEKMEMQGQPINLSNLKEAAEEKFQTAKENVSKSRPLRRLTETLRDVIKILASVISVLIGLAIMFASIGAMIGIFFTFGNVIFNANSPYIDFPIKEFLSGASFYVATAAAFLTAFIPVIFLLILGASLIRRKLAFTLVSAVAMLMIWIIALTMLGVFAIRVAPQYEERMNSLQNSEQLTQSYDFKNFDSLKLDGNQKITVMRGDDFKVEAVGRQSDLDATKVTLENSTLKIRDDYKPKVCVFCFDLRRAPEFSVTLPSLVSFEADGVVKSDIRGFDQAELSFDLDGVSNTTADITVRNLKIEADGVSKLNLSGSAENMTANLDGPSTLSATDLEVKNIKIDSDGPSTARLFATDKLEIISDGPSNIQYKGNPSVTKDTDGPSRVRRLE